MTYNVVSGLRRSGTSLMMLSLRQSGIPIIGLKFAVNTNGDTFTPDKREKEGNPDGYWELGSITSVHGLKKGYDIGMDGDVIKITADALYFSDPCMINRVIVMERNMDDIIRSMLKGGLFKDSEIDLAIEKNKRDISRTYDWLDDNNKDFMIVSYEKLVSDPETIKKACKFICQNKKS